MRNSGASVVPAVKNNCEPRANFSQNTRPDSRNRVIPTDYQLRRATGALTSPGPLPQACARLVKLLMRMYPTRSRLHGQKTQPEIPAEPS